MSAESGRRIDHAPRPRAAQHPLIVALDGHEHDADVLALARALQAALGGALLIAHVIPAPPPGRGMVEYEVLTREEGRKLLAQAAERCGAGTEARLLEGRPAAEALAELADDQAGSTLVLGSSHRGAVGRIVPGRTASQLVQRAHCPVAIAPAGYAGSRSTRISVIGVAYDGTAGADLALSAAIDAARRLRVPLRLYHVRHPVSQDPSWNLVRQNVRRIAREILVRGLQQIPGDLTATGTVIEGEIAQVIAKASSMDDVGLLYAGCRGYGPLREALAHGVVGGLITAAACPLVVVPARHEG